MRLPSLLLGSLALAACGNAEAINDEFTVEEDHSLDIDVLANDDGEAVQLLADPADETAHGTLETLGGGRFRYTPDPDFVGDDFFPYRVTRGNSSATAKVVIHVTETLKRFRHQEFPIESFAHDVATADFDGNGRLDIALLRTEGALTMFMQQAPNDAGPVFTQLHFPERSLSFNLLASMAIADFDADGLPDVAFPSVTEGIVVMRWVSATGTFEALTHSLEPVKPVLLAVGDFDGNGVLDAAVTPDDFSDAYWVKDLRVENGQLSSSAPLWLAGGAADGVLKAFDVDQDGVTDLLTSASLSSNVTLYRGGHFEDREPSLTTLTFGWDLHGLTPQNTGGDDRADVLVTSEPFFASPFVDSTRDWLRWMPAFRGRAGLCDVDDDGAPELVLLSSVDIYGVVRFWSPTNTQPLNFAERGDYRFDSDLVGSLTTADLDQDGMTDVITAGWTGLHIAWGTKTPPAP